MFGLEVGGLEWMVLSDCCWFYDVLVSFAVHCVQYSWRYR